MIPLATLESSAPANKTRTCVIKGGTIGVIDKRTVLAGLAGATIGSISTGKAFAKRAAVAGVADVFSFDILAERMRALASRSYLPPADALPAVLANLTYDEYM